jgi:hypothetical protein
MPAASRFIATATLWLLFWVDDFIFAASSTELIDGLN